MMAALYRLRYPGETTCYNCGLPWSAVKNSIHDINVGERDGFFTCCEYCWSRMGILNKIDSVRELYKKYGSVPGWPYSYDEMLEALERDENSMA